MSNLTGDSTAASSRRGRGRVMGIGQSREELEKVMFESLQMKLEKEIFERVEDALLESKATVKKLMIGGVVGCMLMIGLVKLLG
ncbi:hypothetical protein Bca52824_015141 [Brassica carinata]|uniref:Uncharacterized protein n=1 Tax=Brassica carinata TaxID=52824 RepID=A0A8X7W4E7_BRACI|nr:hypothetical protein Bca52824_015141 [Brassica carinata]